MKKLNIKLKTIIRCPVCLKFYETKLQRKHPEILIQDEFPKAKAIEREQLISGICSDSCWEQVTIYEED